MSHLVVLTFRESVGVFLDASPYILLGLFAAGLLHAFCPPERILRGLGPRRLRSVVKAAVFTAVVAGVFQNIFDGKAEGAPQGETPESSHCDCEDCNQEARGNGRGLVGRLRVAVKYGFGELLSDLAVWLTLGLVLAGVVGALVPTGFF